MNLSYYSDTDSLYIDLLDIPSVDSREVAPGVVFDFDADGHLVGIDIQNASQTVNLTRIEADAAPLYHREGSRIRLKFLDLLP